jgi:hypothetical protein
MDVNTAFFYAKLKEKINMYPPEGMKGIPKGESLEADDEVSVRLETVANELQQYNQQVY